MQVLKKGIYIVLILISSVAIVSCNDTARKVTVSPYEILHDNSSKVWILKSQFVNGIDRTPYNRLDNWVITFYKDRTFVLTTLAHFADFSFHQGSFTFNEDNSILTFKWNSGEIDENEVELIDRENLIYKIKQSDLSFLKVHFIPINKNPIPTNIDL